MDLEKQSSMRPIATYKSNYVNSAGYWLAFHEAAAEMRHEAAHTAGDNAERVHKLDFWMMISVRYALSVLGHRTEFYKMAAEDPTTAKMILPGLEKRANTVASDDLEESMEKLETHMSTQLMKEVAALRVTNAGKKNSSGPGGPAHGK